MPCPAHHGDAGEAVGLGGADGLAHGCLPERRFSAGGGRVGAHRRHRLGDRGEGLFPRSVLDDVLPPTLGVVVAGRSGELTDGVDRRSLPSIGGDRERVGERQIDGPHRHSRRGGVAHCHPFGTERGEGEERGTFGLIGDVAEQGDGRDHVGIGDEPEDRFGLLGGLEQDDVGAQLRQGPTDRPGRAGPVVADPEEHHLAGPVRGHGSRARHAV